MLIFNKYIKICFIGDSLVNGACDVSTPGWTGRVSAKANNNGQRFTYYNLGIRGNTSTDYETEAIKQETPFIDLYQPLIDDEAYLRDISKNDECYPPGYHPTSVRVSKISGIVSSSINWWGPTP